MNLTILPDKVLLDGHDLLKLRESAQFLARFRNPSRRRDIPKQPGGTRVAMVWDELGLVAYEDRPDGLMSHLFLAFVSADTPEHPIHAAAHTIEINGGMITGATLEHTLPREGQTPILADSGKHFFCETSSFGLEFGFQRRPNPHGRYPITGSLQWVGFSWRKQNAALLKAQA